MFDINGWELIIILVIAAVVIGPEHLPEYAAKLRRLVRDLKQLAEGAKEQLREQMGPEFDDIDWKAYDPRQYDPRRIVREALMEDGADDVTTSGAGATGKAATVDPHLCGTTAADVDPGHDAPFLAPSAVHDPVKATPYDDEAT